LNYSREHDWVLDPFGGSGVTAIESFLENRFGIQNDINPLANFIAKGIANLEEGALSDYKAALDMLKESCEGRLEELQQLPAEAVAKFKRGLKMPENIPLPNNSDVPRYHELFSTRQITALAFMRQQIDRIDNRHARRGMLLAWSATLAKLNRTFLSAEGRAESRGGSSIFSIYRYKIAKEPVELPPWKTFEERARNILSAKIEIDKTIEVKRRTTGWFGKFETHQKDIDDLVGEFKGRIDYIFTDPPYGGHISYLDLSILWNCWLGTMPSAKARERELIVGGDLDIEESAYIERLGKSIRSCVDMLKHGRWLSVVFQHWNTTYFNAILSSAAECGADLRAAVPQVGDTIWSMHKKKGHESVMAGELILTFLKTGRPRPIRGEKSFDVVKALSEILSAEKGPVLYGEHLFNKMIITAWKCDAIRSLAISKQEFNDLIKRQGWHYDQNNHYWIKGDHAPLFSATT
jgi:hypothetical protein